ncbi:hypothetical protein BBK36DRAFT_1166837 [Trichoderma citrinoviride]|uniref:UspA domain-containing protein n=1 Tax=Trichoderma citrinoviride TaxID=58853 RepID=A0A2T4BI12_9HYPO|nr:hypothetical protein BBK36DRAFT_1166837 [Trichoderma citrinoviride]PTB68966.1 hypothetical protein BBK36DRAFT_1166837 [Trichoderma citrinoviride]
MSIDAMLDMERKEVLALLERGSEAPAPSARSARSDSPYAARSPVRSMLDIAEEEAPASGGASSSNRPAAATQGPVRSMLDVNAPPSPQLIRSMLDISAPPPDSPRRSGRSSTPSSPLMTPSEPVFRHQSSSGLAPHPRSRSDAGVKFAEPRRTRQDPIANYQFSSIMSHGSGPQSSLKWSSSRNSKRESGGSLGDALRGSESGLQLPTDRGRSPFGGSRIFPNQSKSPQTQNRRWGSRSRSPATFSTPPPLPPGKAMLKDGQVVNLNNAYRKLSDANLIQSSGSLAQLPMRKKSVEAGEGRLVKDYVGPDGEHLESSDEEDEESSDDEDRGRKKSPRSLIHGTGLDNGQSSVGSSSQSGGRQALSLLAAAEQERSQVASQQPQYQYRSLFEEPQIKVTNTSGDTAKPSKANRGVHPVTSYDQGLASATPSVMDSDEEAEMDDIKRAQNLSFTMTNILETPEAHRAIRIIYRGDYTRIVQAAEEENHRLRKYLVATDLSDESTHALEWAIGTVLRDGDTLVAIYCIDEETGIGAAEGSQVPDEPKALKEQAAAINLMANTKLVPAQTNLVSEFKRTSAFYLRSESNAGTPTGSPAPLYRGDRFKAEQERSRAVQQITDKVLRLLRKTRLQVRVIVEVLHCKNPRHLVTEVIDLVNPTLVVIGSRGRSALKGVILGSFSNYLVTKSSVPVMVARKKLRKQSKYKRTPVKQVNNISNPSAKSLANAKVD